MRKSIILGFLLVFMSGCTYASKNGMAVEGKKVKFNIFTRSISGDEIKSAVWSNRQISFFKKGAPKELFNKIEQ